MCGICGELRFDGAKVDPVAIDQMRDRLLHRGPDEQGRFVSPSGHAGLGFRRLSIIDLTTDGSQPMANEDGSVRVVFNGEIYNFRDLRDQLIARGHQFRSRSDTETIVHLYEERGPDCVEQLDGMFALAIWDERLGRITLARDRVGKKPLFYSLDGRRLLFVSEIKAMFGRTDVDLAIDRRVLPALFLYGYVPGPQTLYRGIRQLEPGTFITMDVTGRQSIRRYWSLRFPTEQEKRNRPPIERATATSKIRQLVTDAVNRRLVSDVPLGAFLSGGIDSTIVVGVMAGLCDRPVKTFSIGFEGDQAYDETAFARMVADRFHTEHTEFRVKPSAVELLDTLLWHHDGPFGDSSAIPTYLLSRLTRQHVTVALTGDGGDEVFAGYLRFRAALVADRLPGAIGAGLAAVGSLVPNGPNERHWRSRAKRFARGLGLSLHERVTRWNSYFYDDLDELVATDNGEGAFDRLVHLRGVLPEMEGRSPLSQLLLANFDSYLPDDLLVKTDRCTMANSLEARAPFLDKALVEYAALLPDEYKLDGDRTKAILRDAFADLIPREVDGRSKAGFGVPLDAWFRGELRGYVRDLLLAPNARYRDHISTEVVRRTVERHESGTANEGQRLWVLLCFERWLQLLPSWSLPVGAVSGTISSLTS
jgi:asparagine synthase (glutamine-hydrolysing)